MVLRNILLGFSLIIWLGSCANEDESELEEPVGEYDGSQEDNYLSELEEYDDQADVVDEMNEEIETYELEDNASASGSEFADEQQGVEELEQVISERDPAVVSPGQADLVGIEADEMDLAKSPSLESTPAESTYSSSSMIDDIVRRYVVRPGDSLAKISKLFYGSAELWRQLAEYNQIEDPNRIYPGDVIRLDGDQKLQTVSDALAKVKKISITVRSGDTLFSLAQQHLGNGSYWKYIYSFNDHRISNPNKIKVGEILQFITPDAINAIAQEIQFSTSPTH